MTNWKHTLKITHLFTEKEDTESIRESMNKIADVIENKDFLEDFDYVWDFRGEDNLEEANNLINELYDYCDENKIWIEPNGWKE